MGSPLPASQWSCRYWEFASRGRSTAGHRRGVAISPESSTLHGITSGSASSRFACPVALTAYSIRCWAVSRPWILRVPMIHKSCVENSPNRSLSWWTIRSAAGLTVFISHTKRHSPDEEPDDVDHLVARVRRRIAATHLLSYFDDTDLQPGSDWDRELRRNAASSSLLAVRTDLYSGREWCQREFLTAKLAGIPVVTLNAVSGAKERGSFLMDHVPIVGYRDCSDETRNESIDQALNLLVDEALRRALWKLQEEHLRSVGFDWTPLHAPEPVTVIPWLLDGREIAVAGRRVLVLHPDPPLGPDEQTVIEQLFAVAGLDGCVDVLTPRTYANRGGRDL